MNIRMNLRNAIFAFIAFQSLSLCFPPAAFSQGESFDIIQYTAPKGWQKSEKEGVVIYTDVNKSANTFCLLTVYASVPTAGSPQKDFTKQWSELVAARFNAAAQPKTESQTDDGWTSVSGAAQLDADGTTSAVLMTVISGYGRTTSVYTILNDQAYLPQVEAFMASIKMDKTKALSGTMLPPSQNNTSQRQLAGTLKESITMADLAGKWDQGAGSVLTYVNSGTGDYSHTETSFYGQQYLIRADGTFDFLFVGRSGNMTVRERDTGTVTLSGGYITFKFKKRSVQRFQFIAFMTLPNKGTVLSVHATRENGPGMDAAAISALCSAVKGGLIHCVGGEEWARLAPKP